ncbi:MAG: glutamine-hydrolyzing carbamoyl-phosphate synthase small subunit, partial [Microgenomates group bacterium]
DPSYAGQILVITYPLVGNYGVPDPKYFQSKKIQVAGLVVSQHCVFPSHHQSQKTLDCWLKENNIPGISEIDTRSLTQKIRETGTMLGKIVINDKNTDFYDPNKENIVAKVSAKRPKLFRSPKAKKTVCLLDCGYKKAILDCLLERNVNVYVVPWNFNPFAGHVAEKISGIVISNGPGDPKMAIETIETVRLAIKNNIPILGICLGNQILSLAAGAQTYKLKFGHRSVNQPVKDLTTNRCYITSQNHGFAVRTESLPKRWRMWFANLNDETCEGIVSDNRQFMGVQFHPEGHPGPEDTRWVFEEFVKKL